jgi:hypothetical protein
MIFSIHYSSFHYNPYILVAIIDERYLYTIRKGVNMSENNKNKLSHSGLAIGMSLGLIYGLLFVNLALGLSLGLLFSYAGDQKILKKK